MSVNDDIYRFRDIEILNNKRNKYIAYRVHNMASKYTYELGETEEEVIEKIKEKILTDNQAINLFLYWQELKKQYDDRFIFCDKMTHGDFLVNTISFLPCPECGSMHYFIKIHDKYGFRDSKEILSEYYYERYCAQCGKFAPLDIVGIYQPYPHYDTGRLDGKVYETKEYIDSVVEKLWNTSNTYEQSPTKYGKKGD